MTEDITLQELEERVAYLERDAGVSYDQHKFERKIKRITGVEQYTIDTSNANYKAELVVPVDNSKRVISAMDNMEEYGWDIIESSEDKITISIEEGLKYNR